VKLFWFQKQKEGVIFLLGFTNLQVPLGIKGLPLSFKLRRPNRRQTKQIEKQRSNCKGRKIRNESKFSLKKLPFPH